VTRSQPPNIIIFLSDDLGFNDVSWHNDVVITPHLDTLAKEGILLEQHYSQPVCSPTRGALLTGRYPIHTGLHNGIIKPLMPYGLDTSLSTLADELKSLDYTTHAVGKWHLGFCKKDYWPTHRGFDHHFGYLTGAQDYYTHTREDGYDFRDDAKVFRDDGTYSTNLFEQRAIDIIEGHNSSSPLFLYVPFQSVHGPLEVPKKYKNMYSFINDEHRQILLGMVTAMDDAVGNITKALRDSGLYDNSIIVFMSDNGGPVTHGANNWPLRGSKGGMWEGGTRTSAFIHFPKQLTPRVEQGLVHVTDWYPTLVTAAGGDTSKEDLDGVDQWAGFLDPSLPRPRQEMIYNIHYKAGNDEMPVSAIRMGDWKYIWRATGFNGWMEPPEQEGKLNKKWSKQYSQGTNNEVHNALFNLATDPLEKENLSEVYPERAEEMLARLQAYLPSLSNVTYPHESNSGKPSHFHGVWSSGWC